jgi:predicted ATPase
MGACVTQCASLDRAGAFGAKKESGMLSQFRADNFKSLVNVSFEPAGLNLLVGKNNAGKTNLCHALRFLSLTSKMSLQQAAQECTPEPWSLANAYLNKPTVDLSLRCTLTWQGEPLDFDYELSLNAPRIGKTGRESARFELGSETLRLTGGKFSNTVLVENKGGHVRLLHERAFLGEQSTHPDGYVATTAPLDHTMLYRLFDLQTNQRSNLFKDYLASWQYFNLDALRLRCNAAQPLDFGLDSDGGNLASVLFTLKGADERLYRAVVEAARTIEPKLDVINFQAPDPEHVYMFFEDEKGKRFSASNISDGTLRFLTLCTIIVLNRRQASSDTGPPVVMIEEPENGIFVGYLKALFEKIDPSGKDGQYILTSHAPYFIDLFDSCLEGVWVARSQQTHTTLERPPRDRITAQLGQYSLGELHFRGLLE